MAALQLAISAFGGLLAGAWAVGERLLAEAILVSLLNSAFAVEAELHAASASQEQQVGLSSMIISSYWPLKGRVTPRPSRNRYNSIIPSEVA